MLWSWPAGCCLSVWAPCESYNYGGVARRTRSVSHHHHHRHHHHDHSGHHHHHHHHHHNNNHHYHITIIPNQQLFCQEEVQPFNMYSSPSYHQHHKYSYIITFAIAIKYFVWKFYSLYYVSLTMKNMTLFISIHVTTMTWPNSSASSHHEFV